MEELRKSLAIYAGTFNPFTIGHFEVLKKACEIFDVTVAICQNSTKTEGKLLPRFNEVNSLNFNAKLVADGLNVKVRIIDGLVAEYAKENHIHYLIRGIRDAKDFFYEEELAHYNKMINPEIETIYFRADSYISGSFVRELKKHGADVSKYVYF